jgi:dTDP-4-dehydrorhamnose reductase
MLGRVLVVGCNGQLGRDMMLTASAYGFETEGIDYPDIDLTSVDSTRAALGRIRPRTVVNCAAYTAVDACETNLALAFAVNAEGCAVLARCAREAGVERIAHFSTDYVFDGKKDGVYTETDVPNPQSVYGQSKLAGELLLVKEFANHFIFRIAWLYGCRGPNFVKTIRKVAWDKVPAGEPLRVVNDQFGSPTYTMEVCRQMWAVVQTNNFGLYHCTAEGSCSWFDFTSHIVARCAIPVTVAPCTTAEFPRPAPRPANSVLENARLKCLGLNGMKEWRAAFDDFLAEERRIESGGTPTA